MILESLQICVGSGLCHFVGPRKPSYLVLLSISKEVPKSSWVTAFRQFDKAVGTGAESKQHIIQTHQGTHIGLADFHAVCKSLRAEHRGWDGYLLYET